MSETAQCEYCNQPLGTTFFRFQGRSTCANCGEQVRALAALNDPSPQHLLIATLAGAAAAVAFAFAWAWLVKTTKYEIGIVAAAAGWVIAFAAMKASGERRGIAMQIICVLLAIAAIYLGKGLTYAWALWDQILAQEQLTPEEAKRARWFVLLRGGVFGFQPMDLLWYGFAIFEAWRRPRAIPVQIEGPFSSASAGSPIQFDKAEFHR